MPDTPDLDAFDDSEVLDEDETPDDGWEIDADEEDRNWLYTLRARRRAVQARLKD